VGPPAPPLPEEYTTCGRSKPWRDVHRGVVARFLFFSALPCSSRRYVSGRGRILEEKNFSGVPVIMVLYYTSRLTPAVNKEYL